jgi:hypothetical protein
VDLDPLTDASDSRDPFLAYNVVHRLTVEAELRRELVHIDELSITRNAAYNYHLVIASRTVVVPLKSTKSSPTMRKKIRTQNSNAISLIFPKKSHNRVRNSRILETDTGLKCASNVTFKTHSFFTTATSNSQ